MTDDLVKDIAGDLDCGFRCFVHHTTRKVLTLPDFDQHPDADTDSWKDSMEQLRLHSHDYIEIYGMDNHDAFRAMEDFSDTVDHDITREKLKHVLSLARPFRNFKFAIDQSGKYREAWFAFKAQRLMDRVRGQLKQHHL